ncbi:pilus assembly protein [Zobellella endophytica]|uniref:Pilus assembly protein n=1 Tax=Zobellella endophytica TaxID=2116700 RepID=A0A2P7R946_9GAMM|nr:pilus assembly protein [Zobellella endophytica]PSJ46745.1 pilus assembly protein [Zobellella endophytica]
MNRLELDFQSRRPASPLGWVLLLLGLLCAGVVLLVQWQLAEATAGQRQALAEARQGLPDEGTGSVGGTGQDAALLEMQRVSAQLNRPWDGLFGLLEGLQREQIALLSLTPDARQRQLRISAEARDLPAMLAFHRELEQSGPLSDVSLLSHEILPTAERPIRFNLLATWEVADARP